MPPGWATAVPSAFPAPTGGLCWDELHDRPDASRGDRLCGPLGVGGLLRRPGRPPVLPHPTSAMGTADRLGQGGGPVNRGDRRGDVLVIGGPVADRDPQNLAIMPP